MDINKKKANNSIRYRKYLTRELPWYNDYIYYPYFVNRYIYTYTAQYGLGQSFLNFFHSQLLFAREIFARHTNHKKL